MDPVTERLLILAQIRSMISLIIERMGSDPYSGIDLDQLTIADLSTLRRQLHEILYAPPSRNR